VELNTRAPVRIIFLMKLMLFFRTIQARFIGEITGGRTLLSHLRTSFPESGALVCSADLQPCPPTVAHVHSPSISGPYCVFNLCSGFGSAKYLKAESAGYHGEYRFDRLMHYILKGAARTTCTAPLSAPRNVHRYPVSNRYIPSQPD
jgi:hypothetical protein